MIEIRQLNPREPFPWKLLYTADPSREAVADYTARGVCFGAWESGKIIGVSVLLRTRPFTMELVNLAVEESCHRDGPQRRMYRPGSGNGQLRNRATGPLPTLRILDRFDRQRFFQQTLP